MMTPWDDPYYLKRVWCIFEIYTANTTPNCKAEIVMPAEQKKAMIEESLSDINNLLNALAKTKIENAKATQEDDKKNIFALVEESVGHAKLNNIVNLSIRKSLIGVVKEEAHLRVRGLTDASTDLDHACFCHSIGKVWGRLDFKLALEMHNKALAIREKELGKEHPLTATCYNSIGLVMKKLGNNVGALEMLNKAHAINEKVFGKEHRVTAQSYNNIRAAMKAMGDNGLE